MRNASILAVALGTLIGLACSEVTPPKPGLGPPVILTSSITLDSAAKLGHFRFVAHDPDGPVDVSCVGAFAGEGTDSLVLVRPFTELRLAGDYLTTTCEARESDSTVVTFAGVEYEYAIDRPPSVDLPLPYPTLHVGDPSLWPLQVTDDWALREYWFSIAPGVDPDCTLHWTRVGTWPGTNRTAIDTAVTVTFTTTGPHCVVLGAQDDLGRNVGCLDVVEVAP